jgi:hypothetical protein
VCGVRGSDGRAAKACLAKASSQTQINPSHKQKERKNMKKVEKIFMEYDSDIFFVAEDVRAKRKGIFPKTESIFSRWRMGK